MEVNRYDYLPISTRAYKTDEGYLKSKSILTRVGIFNYIDESGNIRKEYRPPEEVFKSDSINSLKLKPLTNDHPETGIDINNIKELSIGFIGEEIDHDDSFLSGSIIITDKDSIKSIQDKEKNQLSCGYKCTLVMSPGTYKGERYDAIQTNIIYNHVAIVKRGRAGVDARIRLDSNDAYCIIEDKDYTVCVNDNNKKDKAMKKIVIDGVEYDVDESFIHIYNQLKKDSAELSAIKSKLEAEKDDLLTKNSVLIKENETLKNDSVSKEELVKLVKERADVYEFSKKHLSEEEVLKLDEMEVIEIKKMVLSKKYDGIESKEDAYINARYDIMKEDNAVDVEINRKKVIGDIGGTVEVKNDSVSARERYIENLKNAYKTEVK